jgi:hypothetical protein
MVTLPVTIDEPTLQLLKEISLQEQISVEIIQVANNPNGIEVAIIIRGRGRDNA